MTALPQTGPRRGRRRTWAGLGAVPLAGWLVLFFLVPVAVVLYFSFGYKPDVFTTHALDVLSLDRYGEALSQTFLAIFLRTLRIAAVGTLICLVVAFPIAYWMAVTLPARWRGVVLALVLVPYWTNFLIRTIGWQIALSPDGFVSRTLQDLGLLTGPLQVLYTPTAVQIGVVYNYLPLMILPLYVALERLDPRLLEASRDLGASAWRTFVRVTLPLSAAGVAAGCLLVFVPLMGDYITPSVLGGASGSMVGQMVAGQFQSAQNWALGSAMAVLLMLAILATVAVVGLVVRAAVGTVKNLTSITVTPREA
jgi:spermidine/putrescine transport system permease protein